MQIRAITKSLDVSPRKMRLVADAIKRMSATQAVSTLSLLSKRAALPLSKTIKSAIANAVHNKGLKSEDLIISRLEITEAQALKRFHPSTRGRAHPYKKKRSHVTVILEDTKGATS